jgi:hypothetical protein
MFDLAFSDFQNHLMFFLPDSDTACSGSKGESMKLKKTALTIIWRRKDNVVTWAASKLPSAPETCSRGVLMILLQTGYFTLISISLAGAGESVCSVASLGALLSGTAAALTLLVLPFFSGFSPPPNIMWRSGRL